MAGHWKMIRVDFEAFRIIKQKFRKVYGNMCCIFGISDTICVINAFADGTDLISKLFRIILTQFSIFRVNSTDGIFFVILSYAFEWILDFTNFSIPQFRCFEKLRQGCCWNRSDSGKISSSFVKLYEALRKLIASSLKQRASFYNCAQLWISRWNCAKSDIISSIFTQIEEMKRGRARVKFYVILTRLARCCKIF